MSLLERLKEETSELHKATEILLLGPQLMAGTLAEQEFLSLLYVHLYFHDALERALLQHIDFFSAYDLPARRKVAYIEADLKALNAPLPDKCPALFADWSVYQLLGAAYVSEGSTLGMRVISNVLKKNILLPPEAKSSNFYQGYGEMTGPRWTMFRAFLLARADQHNDEVIQGACKAFSLFQQLFMSSSTVLHQTEA